MMRKMCLLTILILNFTLVHPFFHHHKLHYLKQKNPLLDSLESTHRIVKIVSDQRDRTLVVLLSSSLTSTETQKEACYWRSPETGKWEPRRSFSELIVGQKLRGVLVQDLLSGKTGPKVWFDCGVCTQNSRAEETSGWRIVTGLCRIRKHKKDSVVRKQVSRLRSKSQIGGGVGGVDVWVSRIFPSNGQFEVTMKEYEDEILQEELKRRQSLVSVSALQLQQELIGQVVRVEDYGVLVDVGANRHGLLHIQTVANLLDQYIDKSKGLEEVGLELGAKIRVVVKSNERKRLLLDFPEDVKREEEKERALKQEKMTLQANYNKDGRLKESSNPPLSVGSISPSLQATTEVDESYTDATADEESNDEDDYYDDDDEDRSIEDALGIGMYY
jgi:predicted RNA-binding protein with RPS1 domain